MREKSLIRKIDQIMIDSIKQAFAGKNDFKKSGTNVLT